MATKSLKESQKVAKAGKEAKPAAAVKATKAAKAPKRESKERSVEKTAKKARKEKKAVQPESESEGGEEASEEVGEEAGEEVDEEVELIEQDEEQPEGLAEDGLNPKSAWMTAEQREEKKKAQKEEQKRLRSERKLAKPGYELILSCRSDWDIARRLDTPKERRTAALERLFKAFTGQFKDLILKHEGSRVVQTCVKHGSAEQRRQIAAELKGAFVEVAKNKYGRHIVTKLLLYCPEQRDAIMGEFTGHIVKTMRHKEAAAVVETIFADYANAARKQRIVQEFYGAEWALFQKEATPLRAVVADKQPAAVEAVEAALGWLLTKGNLALTLVHRLVVEFLDAAPAARVQEWIGSTAEFLPEIVHTSDGARAAAKCLALAGAKDRKAIVKSLKPFVEKTCRDDRGFQVVIAAFALVDDTVLTGKALLGEMLPVLEALLRDKHARRVVAYLVCGANPRLLPSQTVQLLKELEAQSTSRKEGAVRLRELRSQVLPDVAELLVRTGASLVKDNESAVFLSEMIGGLLAEQQTAVLEAVLAAFGDAAFAAGPKCEFLKKTMKVCGAGPAGLLLDTIAADLEGRAGGEGAYMLMHMLRFPELAQRLAQLAPRLQRLGTPSAATLLARVSA